MNWFLKLCFLVGLFITNKLLEAFKRSNKYTNVFDGIGAISGGGATSKLLVNYPEKQRNEILDYLFKPKFGASLQILKVEIGGDSQSTDGSESSHMHSPDDENYNRGYEWWIMEEAKKRNPLIKLYALPWVFPGWLGDEKKLSPYNNITATVRYLINWIKGAKIHHGLDIDYIGIWNERECNAAYVKLLKKTLHTEGFSDVKIVAPDAMDWSFVNKLIDDPDFKEVVDIIGQHYPGGFSPRNARELGKKLWASEDYSTSNDVFGTGCWARVLNEGYAFGRLTSFIAWNLVTSYYEGLPYSRNSLMTANQPWSGHYQVQGPIWITAHHTHFYDVGWIYLFHGPGMGMLKGNGTYISLNDPSHKHITVVIETIDPTECSCFYPMHVNYTTVASSQNFTFRLGKKFKDVLKLHLWMSRLNYSHEMESVFMQRMPDIQVENGVFTIEVYKNSVITLTTVAKETNISYPANVPESQNFPVPYLNDFESYKEWEEPFNLAQQSGSFEVTKSLDLSHNMVLTQTSFMPPIDTCQIKFMRPLVLVGDYRWKNVRTRISAYISRNHGDVGSFSGRSSHGVFIAAQVQDGGCDVVLSSGIHFFVDLSIKQAFLSSNHNMTKLLNSTSFDMDLYDKWFTIQLDVTEQTIEAMIDNDVIFHNTNANITSLRGFVLFGPMNFGLINFDDFVIGRAEL